VCSDNWREHITEKLSLCYNTAEFRRTHHALRGNNVALLRHASFNDVFGSRVTQRRFQHFGRIARHWPKYWKSIVLSCKHDDIKVSIMLLRMHTYTQYHGGTETLSAYNSVLVLGPRPAHGHAVCFENTNLDGKSITSRSNIMWMVVVPICVSLCSRLAFSNQYLI